MLSLVTSTFKTPFTQLVSLTFLVIANVWFAVALSRIDQSSWNMHHIKAEYFMFHIVYVTQLFFLVHTTHFVKVRHIYERATTKARPTKLDGKKETMDESNCKTQTDRWKEAHPQIQAYNPHGRGQDWQWLSAELESSNDGRTDSLSEQGWISSQGVCCVMV